jgi:hypothetical protein
MVPKRDTDREFKLGFSKLSTGEWRTRAQNTGGKFSASADTQENRCRYVYQTPTLWYVYRELRHKINALAASRINVLATSRINVLATSRINVVGKLAATMNETGFLAGKETQINFWRTAGMNIWPLAAINVLATSQITETCGDLPDMGRQRGRENLSIHRRHPGRNKLKMANLAGTNSKWQILPEQTQNGKSCRNKLKMANLPVNYALS